MTIRYLIKFKTWPSIFFVSYIFIVSTWIYLFAQDLKKSQLLQIYGVRNMSSNTGRGNDADEREFSGRRARSDICFDEAIMGDIKERRNGQKDETEAKRRNKRRCEKSRPAIASTARRRNKTWKKRQL